MLLQSSAVGAFLTFYIGDISNLLAAAPAALLQARYSQDLERQADDYGAALLLHNGMSPCLARRRIEQIGRSACEFLAYCLSLESSANRRAHPAFARSGRAFDAWTLSA